MPLQESSGTAAWGWWMQCLADLVWPAEGLGRWEPRAACALKREELRRRLLESVRSKNQTAAARLLRLLGEPEADAALERAWHRRPGNPEARLWLAEARLDESPLRALRLLQGLDGPWAALYRGAALMKLKRWRPAAAAFRSAQTLWPEPDNRALPGLLAASALLRAGAAGQALTELNACQKAGCDEAALHWLRAFVYDRLGRAQKAAQDVEEAMRRFSELALDPLLGEALRRENLRGGRCRPPSARTLALLSLPRRGLRQAWACVARAETLRSPEFSRYAEAVAWLRRAARLTPRSAWVWAYLGRGLDSIGESRAAKEALDAAVSLAPRSGWIRAWRGSWLLRRGRSSALPELGRAAALSPGYPFARAWLGGALRRAGLLRPAAQELELALLLEPGYEWSYAELFQTRRQQENWEAAAALVTEAYEREMKFTWARREDPRSCRAALRELTKALAAHPRHGLLRAWRAWTLLALGRLKEAHDEALPPPAGGPAFACAVAAEIEEALGRLDGARVCYDRAVALKPCAAYLGCRGLLLQKMGRPRRALADLRRAVALNGTVARFQCALGQTWLDLKRPRRALEALDKAVGLDPAFCQALALRAEAWRRLGRRRSALRDLARARRLRPECPWSALTASRLAGDEVRACAELIKAVDAGRELPPAMLEQARRRMAALARKALRSLTSGKAPVTLDRSLSRKLQAKTA